MCVLSDVVLNGLLLTSTESPLPNPVFSTNGEISEMLLSLRYTPPRLVKPDSDEISEMLLSLMNSHSSLVKPDSDEIAEMLLSLMNSHFRLVKPDSDGIFEMRLLSRTSTPRLVKPDSGEISEMRLLLRTICSRKACEACKSGRSAYTKEVSNEISLSSRRSVAKVQAPRSSRLVKPDSEAPKIETLPLLSRSLQHGFVVANEQQMFKSKQLPGQFQFSQA